jgi:hypothetical protein
MVVALDRENTLGKSEWFTAGYIDQFEIDHVDNDVATTAVIKAID